MARVFNFSAGPAAMPEPVLREAQQEMLEYKNTGMSVLEMSHRSKDFQAIIDDAEATLRRLYGIPSNYHVLFLQGGATLQFSAVPMNLLRGGHAGYIVSGNWSQKAYQEACRYGDIDLLATSEATNFDRTPELAGPVSQDLDYLYFCQNETVFGTMRREVPQAAGQVPVVADISSCFLSMPLDISRYGLLYAGAQKNGGPAGVTVVIVRDDLVGEGPALPYTPIYMGYRLQCNKDSMYNTPNTYGIYLCGKVFRWIEQTGGLEAMEKRNWHKVNKLYDYLDQSALFEGTAEPSSRSIANVTFRTPSPELDAEFVAGAAAHNIANIKGHRLVGGMRASCYNAVPEAGVDALLAYMREFEEKHADAARSR